MKIIDLEGLSGHSTLAINDSIRSIGSYCTASRVVIVTDRIVRSLHGHLFPPGDVIEIGTGEASKTLKTVEGIYEELLRYEVDRSCFIIAIGGGIVCDVAGFAAATYLRGLSFGCVPTTLLAQVDAGIGGKNGVNFHGYKNAIGTFNQPSFVLCDFDLLKTLPEEELKNGFAELIKEALIGDAQLFSFVEERGADLLSIDNETFEHMVHDALRVKGDIVSRDEREKGERRKLNFGHTLGHALEKVYGLRHGEAVSIGMNFAARLSAERGLLSPHDLGRMQHVLAAFGLPTGMQIDGARLADALRKDKKREEDLIHFVLLDGIGSAVVVPFGIDEIRKVIDDLCKPC